MFAGTRGYDHDEAMRDAHGCLPVFLQPEHKRASEKKGVSWSPDLTAEALQDLNIEPRVGLWPAQLCPACPSRHRLLLQPLALVPV